MANQLWGSLDPQLPFAISAMNFDRFDTHMEFLGDTPRSFALAPQAKNLELPVGHVVMVSSQLVDGWTASGSRT